MYCGFEEVFCSVDCINYHCGYKIEKHEREREKDYYDGQQDYDSDSGE